MNIDPKPFLSGCGTHQLQPMGHIERNGNSVKFQSSPVFSGVGDKVRLSTSRLEQLIGLCMNIVVSYKINNRLLSPQCSYCDHRVHIGGPIWADAIHNLEFVNKVSIFFNCQSFADVTVLLTYQPNRLS